MCFHAGDSFAAPDDACRPCGPAPAGATPPGLLTQFRPQGAVAGRRSRRRETAHARRGPRPGSSGVAHAGRRARRDGGRHLAQRSCRQHESRSGAAICADAPSRHAPARCPKRSGAPASFRSSASATGGGQGRAGGGHPRRWLIPMCFHAGDSKAAPDDACRPCGPAPAGATPPGLLTKFRPQGAVAGRRSRRRETAHARRGPRPGSSGVAHAGRRTRRDGGRHLAQRSCRQHESTSGGALCADAPGRPAPARHPRRISIPAPRHHAITATRQHGNTATRQHGNTATRQHGTTPPRQANRPPLPCVSEPTTAPTRFHTNPSTHRSHIDDLPG
jgi:hypothetical protein